MNMKDGECTIRAMAGFLGEGGATASRRGLVPYPTTLGVLAYDHDAESTMNGTIETGILKGRDLALVLRSGMAEETVMDSATVFRSMCEIFLPEHREVSPGGFGSHDEESLDRFDAGILTELGTHGLLDSIIEERNDDIVLSSPGYNVTDTTRSACKMAFLAQVFERHGLAKPNELVAKSPMHSGDVKDAYNDSALLCFSMLYAFNRFDWNKFGGDDITIAWSYGIDLVAVLDRLALHEEYTIRTENGESKGGVIERELKYLVSNIKSVANDSMLTQDILPMLEGKSPKWVEHIHDVSLRKGCQSTLVTPFIDILESAWTLINCRDNHNSGEPQRRRRPGL